MKVKGAYIVTPDGDWWLPLSPGILELLTSWGWQSYPSLWSSN